MLNTVSHNKVPRNSNMELLRIAAMLMIIAYHFELHCITPQLENNSLFNSCMFYRKLLILQALEPLGKTGDAIFILISGYFMFPKGRNIDLYKVSKKLLFPLGFASIILVILSTVCYKLFPNRQFDLYVFPYFNTLSWFAGYYFLIIVIAKLFLNNFLSGLDRPQFLSFIAVIFAVVQFTWSGDILDNFSSGLRNLGAGIFLYSLGGFISRYDPFEKVYSFVFAAVILFCYGLVFLSFYNSTVTRTGSIIAKLGSEAMYYSFAQKFHSFYDYSIISIAVGVSIFELFRRIHIPTNKVINYLGSATFMVYLFHDNPFAYSVWAVNDWITLLYDSPAAFILKLAVWVLLTFTAGVTVYALYQAFLQLLHKTGRLFLKNTGDGFGC